MEETKKEKRAMSFSLRTSLISHTQKKSYLTLGKESCVSRLQSKFANWNGTECVDPTKNPSYLNLKRSQKDGCLLQLKFAYMVLRALISIEKVLEN